MKKYLVLIFIFLATSFINGQSASQKILLDILDKGDVTPPSVPQTLLAVGAPAKMTITSDANTDAVKWVLYRSDTNDSAAVSVIDSGLTTSVSKIDTPLTEADSFYYFAKFVDASGNRSYFSAVAWDTVQNIQYAGTYNGTTQYLNLTPDLMLTDTYVTLAGYVVSDSAISSNQAYGEWEFSVFKTNDAGNVDVHFVNDKNSATTNSGYFIRFGSDEKVYLYSNAAGTPTARITSSGTYSLDALHPIIVTRTTAGLFTVTVDGASIGTATNTTYTTSNYSYVDVGSGDYISAITFTRGEGSLDANGYERLYARDNTFENDTSYFTGNGTASCETTTSTKYAGSRSLKFIATGVGDSTTNYASLPASQIVTLEVGKKYTLEFWMNADSTGGYSGTKPRVTAVIGNKSLLSDTISIYPNLWEKYVYNFEADASTVGQALRIYSSQADTIYIDNLSITEAKDATINVWFKTDNNGSNKALLARQSGTAATDKGFMFIKTSLNVLSFSVYNADAIISATSVGTYIDNVYRLATVTINRTATTNNITVYVNGTSVATATGVIGNINNTNIWAVGSRSSSAGLYWEDNIGELQITRGYAMTQSEITSLYNRSKYANLLFPTPSSGTVVFYNKMQSVTGSGSYNTTLTNNGTVTFGQTDY